MADDSTKIQISCFCIQLSCLILLLGAILKYQWEWIGFGDSSWIPNWLIISFDLIVVGLSIAMVKHALKFSMGLLLIVFGAFAIFHVFNLGRPCGCFGQGNSSVFSILFNLMFSFGFALAYFFKSRTANLSGATICFLGFAIAIGSTAMSDTNSDFVHPQSFLNQPQPFETTESTYPDFSKGDWDVCLLDVQCGSCLQLAESLLDQRHHLLGQVHPNKMFVVFQNVDRRAPWQIATVSLGQRRKVIPSRLHISSGIVESCVFGHELFSSPSSLEFD